MPNPTCQLERQPENMPVGTGIINFENNSDECFTSNSLAEGWGCKYTNRETIPRDNTLYGLSRTRCPVLGFAAGPTQRNNNDPVTNDCLPDVLFSNEDINNDGGNIAYNKFKTSCGLGDRAKYGDDGTQNADNFIFDASRTGIMCPTTPSSGSSITDLFNAELASCQYRAGGSCENIAPNPPTGYNRLTYTNPNDYHCEITIDNDGNTFNAGTGCEYTYIKDWDHIRWGAPPLSKKESYIDELMDNDYESQYGPSMKYYENIGNVLELYNPNYGYNLPENRWRMILDPDMVSSMLGPNRERGHGYVTP